MTLMDVEMTPAYHCLATLLARPPRHRTSSAESSTAELAVDNLFAALCSDWNLLLGVAGHDVVEAHTMGAGM